MILDTIPRQVTIVQETFSPEEPEPSSSLSLILQVEYELLYLDWEDLSAMGNDILDATLPGGLPVAKPKPCKSTRSPHRFSLKMT